MSDSTAGQVPDGRTTIAGHARGFVLDVLAANVDRAMEIEPIRDSKGRPTGVYAYDSNAALRGIELIAKITGLLASGHEPPGRTVEDLTLEEIKVWRGRLAEKMGEAGE